MISKEERERFRQMTQEEQKAELLDGISDSVREIARKIAMIKAIAKNENGIDPEDFDKAVEKELRKAWDKVKDKNSMELAIMGLFEMATAGEDFSEILGGAE